MGLAGMKLYGAIAGAVVIALFLAWVWRIDHLRGQYKKELAACQQNHAQFVADVKARVDEARRLDAEHKVSVEASQDKVTANASQDYQKQLADLRARYSRVQPKPAKADSSGSGTAPVSQIPDATSGPDVAAATCDLNTFNAEANALQLGGLQNWVRDQAGVER